MWPWYVTPSLSCRKVCLRYWCGGWGRSLQQQLSHLPRAPTPTVQQRTGQQTTPPQTSPLHRQPQQLLDDGPIPKGNRVPQEATRWGGGSSWKTTEDAQQQEQARVRGVKELLPRREPDRQRPQRGLRLRCSTRRRREASAGIAERPHTSLPREEEGGACKEALAEEAWAEQEHELRCWQQDQQRSAGEEIHLSVLKWDGHEHGWWSQNFR